MVAFYNVINSQPSANCYETRSNQVFLVEETEDLLLLTTTSYHCHLLYKLVFLLVHTVMSFPEIKLIATELEVKSTMLVMALST